MAMPRRGLSRGSDTGSWCCCGSQLAAVLLEEAADARDGAAAPTAAPCWQESCTPATAAMSPQEMTGGRPRLGRPWGGGDGTASPSRAPGVPPAPELAPMLTSQAVHPSHTSQRDGSLGERELDKAWTMHCRGHSGWWQQRQTDGRAAAVLSQPSGPCPSPRHQPSCSASHGSPGSDSSGCAGTSAVLRAPGCRQHSPSCVPAPCRRRWKACGAAWRWGRWPGLSVRRRRERPAAPAPSRERTGSRRSHERRLQPCSGWLAKRGLGQEEGNPPPSCCPARGPWAGTVAAS